MKRILALLLALTLTLGLVAGMTGCSKGPGVDEAALPRGELGKGTLTYTYAGQEVVRHYYYYIPSTYVWGEKADLYLTLHGSTSNAKAQMIDGDWQKKAEELGFIMIAPESIAIHADGTLSSEGKSMAQIGQSNMAFLRWNAASTDPQGAYGVDDTAFLCDIIDLFVGYGYVDPDRVFATGLSHGAFMAVRLAVEAPEKIAGIASVAGLLTSEMAMKLSDAKVKVVMFHGTADNVVPYNGMSNWAYSVDQSIEKFMTAYGLELDQIVETAYEDANKYDGCTIARYEYTLTKNKEYSPVKYVITGGGHAWPGSKLYGYGACKDASAVNLMVQDFANVRNPNN